MRRTTMNPDSATRTAFFGTKINLASALPILLAVILLSTVSVRAATYNVTNSNNSGVGSLRQAITDANASPEADTITFDTGIHSNLTGASDEDLNVSGDLDILDGGDLTIQGNGLNGANHTVIDGGGTDRVFDICPGGGCTNTVTLTGLIIHNGSVTGSAGGGGIRNEGTVTIQSCIVGGSIAGNTAYIGGGIYNTDGVLTVDDSRVEYNTASYGGGVYSTGAAAEATFNNNTIVSINQASSNGGGLVNHTGTMTLITCHVNDNQATWNGGGIHNWMGELDIQNGSIIGENGLGNEANQGGGVYNGEGGNVTVDGSIINYNNATGNGGGIYNTGATSTLTIQNGSAIGGLNGGNRTSPLYYLDGGGIYNNAGTITVDGSIIRNNYSTGNGGGIYNTGATATLTIQNGSTIGKNRTSNNPSSYTDGGGIYNDAGTTTVDDSTISANECTGNGGGIYNTGATATLTVQNGSTIGGSGVGNEAGLGGGIYNDAGTTTVDGSTVSANSRGGIYNLDILTVQNGSVIGGAGTGNTAIEGGGIKNFAGTTTVDGSTVSANIAGHGGGIFNNATLVIQNNSTIGGTFAGNLATGGDGGGIYNMVGTTTVDGSLVSANIAEGNGGGIYNKATLSIQNKAMIGETGGSNKTANGSGGGIYNSAGSTIVDDSTVSANQATNGSGGAIFNEAALTVQNGSTIGGRNAGNTTTGSGGGIYHLTGSTTVTGSRILYNTAISGGGVFNNMNSAGMVSVTGSCIVGNSAASFFNNQSPTQAAQGNWWGRATGPDTPGADTTGGNVNTSGYLTAPILGCAFCSLPPMLKLLLLE